MNPISLSANRASGFGTSAGLVPLVLTLTLLLAAFDASANNARSTESLAFDVFLEDRQIGMHTMDRRPNESDERGEIITISANFKVKVLFITAFRYTHNNTETWRDGCLQKIDATTQVNSETFRVAGEASDTGLALSAPEPRPVTSCARSFAYWDRALLESSQLLNTQTGEYLDTTLMALGTGELTIGNRQIPVQRYSLTGKDLALTIAYTLDDQWVGLESEMEGGKTLRYVRTARSMQGEHLENKTPR